jgi:formate dehydrogenase subunit gamma
LGLLNNPDLAPLGSGFANGIRACSAAAQAFSGPMSAWARYGPGSGCCSFWPGIAHFTIPFMRQILTYRLPQDLHWMIKKNFQMILGYKAMAKISCAMGMDERIPDQGYYNAGQKAAAVAFVGGVCLLAVTGLLMVLSKFVFGPEQVALVQWSITLHFVAAGHNLCGASWCISTWRPSARRSARPLSPCSPATCLRNMPSTITSCGTTIWIRSKPAE